MKVNNLILKLLIFDINYQGISFRFTNFEEGESEQENSIPELIGMKCGWITSRSVRIPYCSAHYGEVPLIHSISSAHESLIAWRVLQPHK